MNALPADRRAIHLLYVPTLFCNLDCTYCYLGRQTAQADLKQDAGRAAATLERALDRLEEAKVLAFNVSLHGGEPTTLPLTVLDRLFTRIRRHYLDHIDQLNALGYKKSAPHIKTNLLRFAECYDLFDRHQVSVSASIDLPLALHARHRKTRAGKDWLQRCLDNLRLLARYPHACKISATLSAEHLADIPALIADIRRLHDDISLDMNRLNFMFAFASELNRDKAGAAALTPASPAAQVAFYRAMQQAFRGTPLETGLQQQWFEEFTPSYCTSAPNCGERFFLLQSDGEVYSCVRGQGIPELHYGNLLTDPVASVLDRGARRIAALHQRFGLDAACRACAHLAHCHTGCPVIKLEQASGRSYTCDLQRALYADYPVSWPAATAEEQARQLQGHIARHHPTLAFAEAAPPLPADTIVLPGDLYHDANALPALIAADPVLRELYRDDVIYLAIDDEVLPLSSQLLKTRAEWYSLTGDERLVVHVRRALFAVAAPEPVRNTLTLQLLRDTPVIYGDEQRQKQEHLATHQIFYNCLAESDRLGSDFLMADIGPLIAFSRPHYQRGVRNALLLTTSALRDYHYQKQKNNAFYHIQAINLPFAHFEFFVLP